MAPISKPLHLFSDTRALRLAYFTDQTKYVDFVTTSAAGLTITPAVAAQTLTLANTMGLAIAGECSFSGSLTFTSSAATSLTAHIATTPAYSYDIGSGRIEGKPAASELLMHFVAVRSFTLPAALTGSLLDANASATGSSVFSIKVNGVQIGTCTVAAAGATGTFAAAEATTVVAGDVLEIYAPSSQDATLADLAITLKGTLV